MLEIQISYKNIDLIYVRKSEICQLGKEMVLQSKHSDAQFAGSSSVQAHVEMMGFIGIGNNLMVGATVAVAVAVEEGNG